MPGLRNDQHSHLTKNNLKTLSKNKKDKFSVIRDR